MKKIILPGGAGLVGQNLIVRLKRLGYTDLVVIDKHRANIKILKKLHPDVIAIYADLSDKLDHNCIEYFKSADIVIMLQAQIGGNNYKEFEKNNIKSTENIIKAFKLSNNINNKYIIHISSSVINSIIEDYYTSTKLKQEEIVRNSGISNVILRPTLMFGWFDRKHLGWLSRFMKKVPVFPVPGRGDFIRQPLYVGDFCNIIISCIENNIKDKTYDITGREEVKYIDIIKYIKKSIEARVVILKLPYYLFYFLLWLWGLFDKNPPFTTKQLKALVAGDKFEVINWEEIFNIKQTKFADAIEETFNDKEYSKIVTEF